MSRVTQGRPKKKVANSLVAMSSAAVMAVYAAGYQRTRSAAERFDAQALERRVRSTPVPVVAPPATPPTAAAIEPVRQAEGKPPVAPVAKQKPEPEKVSTAVAVESAAPPEPAASTPELSPAAPAPASEIAAAIPVVPPPPPPPPAPEPPKPTWKDGTYLGWGHVRHGDIEASVVIEGGRIKSAVISQCRTRYDCDVIDKLPAQVAARQSAEVDSVSGATQSADAFYYAVSEALSKAK
jgi:uncharacterized protein with FMN-binding domain